jgi:hypothetical protein
MKNAVFWDAASYSSCVNRRFGGTYRLHLQGRKITLVPRSRISTETKFNYYLLIAVDYDVFSIL